MRQVHAVSRREVMVLAAALVTVAACDQAPAALAVEQPWTRATPGPVRTGGVFLVLHGGPEDDVLTGAECPRAARVELHEHVRTGDTVMMQAVTGGLPVPAGQAVPLAPGGYHLMVFGLDGPLVAGEVLPLTLIFAKAGRVAVAVPVKPADFKPPR